MGNNDRPDHQRILTELEEFNQSSYQPAPYLVPQTVENRHNSPRFGLPSDITPLLDGSASKNDATDYIVGIAIGAIIVLAVALVWFFVIVSLKVAGSEKVGFLAGRFSEPAGSGSGCNGAEKEGTEVQLEDNGRSELRISTAVPVADEGKRKSFKRRVWFVRGMFILSGIGVIVGGALFYSMGVTAFQSSLNSVKEGLDLTQAAAFKAIDLTNNVLKASDDVEQEIEEGQEVEREAGQICGLDDEVAIQIQSAYSELETNVDQFKRMIEGSLKGFEKDLRSLVSLTESIDDSLDSANIVFVILIAISMLMIGLILAQLVGVLLSIFGISNWLTCCIRNAVIWPLFTLLLVLSWILATLFLVLSVGGADFCISPDAHVQTLLNRNEDQFDGILFGFIIFYVSGCSIAPPGTSDIMDLVGAVKGMVDNAHALIETVGDMNLDRLGETCGLTAAQAAAFNSLVTLAHDATHVVNRSMIGLREVLECETFNPIYQTFVHNAFCVDGVSGLSIIFSTTLAMAIFSMMMITFRAALHPVQLDNKAAADEGAEDDLVMYEGGRGQRGDGVENE